MKLHVAIQTHPSRADLIPPLLEQLPGATVATDPGGELSSAWRSQRIALRSAPEDATHVLVLQDDVILCDQFLEVSTAAIAARPDAAIAFFTPGAARVTGVAMTQAVKQRLPWCAWNQRDFWPCVASSYPREVAEDSADFGDSRVPVPRGDDAVMADFLRARRVPAFVTVPSLVEHLDDQPSLIGRRHLSGADPGRVAKFYVGDADATKIRW